ncbi:MULTISPECIES: helix-turn-helix domain-containing protein [unclassified Methylobacterium]|jgi:ribosome-binding protein aMBF1 (putative translation factor)|uniref:helix-turn-helix domain-containing protein n=1 Tax=unclassified Methylobacterium TaxID=2615210 RepID=UPI00135498E9|nr:helix-turn-helix transcriptional regulator [Methylobacterium sp. 2A]MWV21544.1 helix-turn-helix transcriptional regulator [Methylobacterium sp. 2A]
MAVQTIVTPSGERLIVLSESAYTALLEAAEDGADRAAVAAFRRRFDAGDEEFVPGAVVDRLLAGENRIRVWREHRGLEAEALAQRADITLSEISQIEAGTREGTVGTYRKIAEALGVDLDDLVA